MRDIPQEILDLLAGSMVRPFYLLHFEIDGTPYRYTDCDVPIVYGGNVYSPRSFKAPAIEATLDQTVSKLKVDLDNVDQILMIPFVGGDAAGSQIDMRLVYLDSSYQLVSNITGPIGRWIIKQGLGDYASDWSGNNLHGALQNSPVWTAITNDHALDLESSSSQWVDLGKPASLAFTARPFAISAWTKPESLPNWATIFNKSDGGWISGGYGINMDASGNLMFWVENYNTNRAFKAFSTIGSWAHILAVWESDGTMQIYIAGAAGTSDSYTGSLTNQDKKACIGAYNDGGAGYWDGLVRDVQIFNRDLTATEKATLAAGGYVGPGAVLLFDGEIDSFDVDEEVARIAGVGELSQWTRTTLSPQVDACRWKIFKGTECAYAGGQSWCDRTYDRCVALSNAANFGGDRFISSLQNKIVHWGN